MFLGRRIAPKRTYAHHLARVSAVFRDSAIGSTSAFGAESPGSSPGPGTRTRLCPPREPTLPRTQEWTMSYWPCGASPSLRRPKSSAWASHLQRAPHPEARTRVSRFRVESQPSRGLQQNPQRKSRWAQMARKGAKVMQFLSRGRYTAVVAGGKIFHYSPKQETQN